MERSMVRVYQFLALMLLTGMPMGFHFQAAMRPFLQPQYEDFPDGGPGLGMITGEGEI